MEATFKYKVVYLETVIEKTMFKVLKSLKIKLKKEELLDISSSKLTLLCTYRFTGEVFNGDVKKVNLADGSISVYNNESLSTEIVRFEDLNSAGEKALLLDALITYLNKL